jgi:vacuolar-type H+-ATPase subunit C/Vma6
MSVSGGERAYVYAKSRGIIGKSFVGKRLERLYPVTKLPELDALIFSGQRRELPERELLLDLERRITARAAGQILKITGAFSNPPELLTALIKNYEYADLKMVLSAVAGGAAKIGPHVNIGPLGSVNFAAYPDLNAMLKGTEFAWIAGLEKSEFEGKKGILLQIKLDSRYYEGLWAALRKTPRREREHIEKFLEAEISLRNVVWALRLRTYYGFEVKDLDGILVHIKDAKKHDFAEAALESLAYSPGVRTEWQKWRWFSLLNPETPGQAWKADPRYVQNAAAAYLYRLARRAFKQRIFSVGAVFCFIKLKQIEEDFLTSAAEGLRLGIMPRETLSMLGVLP